MKFFAYILSFYVVILTIMPCIDVNQEHAIQKTELSTNQTDNHHNGSDCCTPFCTCTCCASSIVFQYHTIDFKCYPTEREHFSEYYSSYNTSVHVSIWQPPKIC